MSHLWSALGAVAVVVITVSMFLVLPMAFVNPLEISRFVPVVVRARVVRCPSRWIRWLAITTGVASGSVTGALWLAHSSGDSWSSRTFVGACLGLLVGVPLSLAIRRAVRAGSEQWALYGANSSRRKLCALCGEHKTMPRASQLVAPAGGDRGVLDARPETHARDRLLRGWFRSLTAAALSWFAVGRALQAGGKEPASHAWWAIGAVVLMVALLAVASARGWRRRATRRAVHSQQGTSGIRDVMQSLGMTVQLPAGPWVRTMASAAFAPKDSRAGVAPWPWAGIARTPDGRIVVLAKHHGQLPGSTLKSEVNRTACCVRVPGAQLPTVTVTGREGVPVHQLRQAVALELEAFNRALWAFGPDMRGVYALLHPRAMSEIMATLPDGATVVFAGDCVAVYCDEPVLAQLLPAYVSAALALSHLIPTYLLAAR